MELEELRGLTTPERAKELAKEVARIATEHIATDVLTNNASDLIMMAAARAHLVTCQSCADEFVRRSTSL